MKSFYASSLRRQSKKEENAQPLEEIKLHKRESYTQTIERDKLMSERGKRQKRALLSLPSSRSSFSLSFVVVVVVFFRLFFSCFFALATTEEISIRSREENDVPRSRTRTTTTKETTTRARWVFEQSGSLLVNASFSSSSFQKNANTVFSLTDVVGARYTDDEEKVVKRRRALEVYKATTGELVGMELAFSRRTTTAAADEKSRATKRSLVNVEEKGELVGFFFSDDNSNDRDNSGSSSSDSYGNGIEATTSSSAGAFALRENGEILYAKFNDEEERTKNAANNITKPFREHANARCGKSKEVFTLFRVNKKDGAERRKAKLCALCSDTKRAGGRVIYDGFCVELNEDDGVATDGEASSFSYIVSREYEPVAFQAVDDYVIALERQTKNDGILFRLQMFSSEAILVSSKLKSPVEPILAYSSSSSLNSRNKNKDDESAEGGDDNAQQFKFVSLAYSVFNDDEDIAPNAAPNTVGIFAIGVPSTTTTNTTDEIVIRMFNARTEDISAALASANITIKWTWILFVVLTTIVTCSALLLCAASAFVGAPKPFLEVVEEEETEEADLVDRGDDLEERLLEEDVRGGGRGGGGGEEDVLGDEEV